MQNESFAHTLSWVAAIGMIFGLSACHSPSTNLSLLRASTVIPATRPLPASAYGLLTLGTTLYKNLENPAEAPLVITIAKTNRFDGSVSRTINNQRIEYLGTSDRNSIVMYAVTDVERSTTTIFPRPLIMASAIVPPLQPVFQEVPALLVDSENLNDVKAKGIGRRTSVYEGSCVLQTKLGPVTTQQIRTTFTADLSIAQGRYTGLIFVSEQPQPGIVALVLTEELRVFGIQMRSASGTYLREDLAFPPDTTRSSPSSEVTWETSAESSPSG